MLAGAIGERLAGPPPPNAPIVPPNELDAHDLAVDLAHLGDRAVELLGEVEQRPRLKPRPGPEAG